MEGLVTLFGSSYVWVIKRFRSPFLPPWWSSPPSFTAKFFVPLSLIIYPSSEQINCHQISLETKSEIHNITKWYYFSYLTDTPNYCQSTRLGLQWIFPVRGRSVQVNFSLFWSCLQVGVDQKMPSLYLLDSILKNIGGDYVPIISRYIVDVFCHTFEAVRSSCYLKNYIVFYLVTYSCIFTFNFREHPGKLGQNLKSLQKCAQKKKICSLEMLYVKKWRTATCCLFIFGNIS